MLRKFSRPRDGGPVHETAPLPLHGLPNRGRTSDATSAEIVELLAPAADHEQALLTAPERAISG